MNMSVWMSMYFKKKEMDYREKVTESEKRRFKNGKK